MTRPMSRWAKPKRGRWGGPNMRWVGRADHATGVHLFDPAWAPDYIRALEPLTADDYTTADREWPSADTFAASTVRRLTGDPVTDLTDFAIDTPRQDTSGRYLEGFAVTRLTVNGDNQRAGLAANSGAVFTDGPVEGDYLSLMVAAAASSPSINASGQTGTFSGAPGDLLHVSVKFRRGTSNRLRARLNGTVATVSTNSTVTIGDTDDVISTPDTGNGTPTNIQVIDHGSGVKELVFNILLTTTATDFRMRFGPNLAQVNVDVEIIGFQVTKTPHQVDLITAVAATGPDLQTRDITGLGLAAMAGQFVLTGWAPGVTEAVLWQADDGTDDNRAVLYVDTATLALGARFVVGGVTVEDLTLGTIVLGATFTAALSWASSDWRAQLRNEALQTSVVAGTLPALTAMRYAKGAAAQQASMRAVNRFCFDKLLSSGQIEGVLAAAAGPFEPLGVSSQAQLDTPETVNSQSYIKDAFPGEWTIRRHVQQPGKLRFETRLGHRDVYDEVDNRPYYRSELHSTPSEAPSLIWLAFDLTPIDITHALPIFEADGVTRRAFTHANVCQLKSSPDPTGLPMFALNINSDGFRVYFGGGDAVADANGDDRADYYFTDIVPTAGDTYRFVAEIMPGAPGVSYARLWLNGASILDVDGFWIGYPEVVSTFVKFGLYCHENVGDMIVDIGDPAFGADLSSRL